MFLYRGCIRARLERLCHRISRSLAEITSAHHPSDVKLFQHWRGLVHLCVPLLSESHHDDSASFVRSVMWDGYLLAPGSKCTAETSLWKNMDHTYADVFCAIREMLALVAPASCGAGAAAQHLELAEHLMAIGERLSILHSRWLRQVQHCGRGSCAAARDKERAGLDVVRNRIPFV